MSLEKYKLPSLKDKINSEGVEEVKESKKEKVDRSKKVKK